MLLSALALATVAVLIVVASGSVRPSQATGASPSTSSFQWGDTDCSGTIDTQDIMRVLNRAAGLPVDQACYGAESQGSADPQPAGASVNIGVDPTDISIPAGETRSVDIVADVTSGLIGSWLVTVQYDPAVVTPVGCSGVCNLDFAPDKVAMANTPYSAISGTVTLASVTFEAKGEAGLQSAVDLTAPDLTDSNGDPMAATLSDGTITIAVSREDLDCRSGVTAQDALDLISYIAGLPTTGHPIGCPALGE